MACDIAIYISNYKSCVNELVQLCEVAEAPITTLDVRPGDLVKCMTHEVTLSILNRLSRSQINPLSIFILEKFTVNFSNRYSF